MRFFGFTLFLVFISAFAAVAAEALPSAHFFDETTNRYVTLDFKDFKKVVITIRAAGSPGSSARWFGDGEKNDKEILFAQTVGAEQERGTYFIAKGGESKLEIGFKPGQKMPQDAGINGVYRHITEEKRFSLAKKEFETADDYLNALFKTTSKNWRSEDKPVIAEWRNRWPALRDKWMKIVYAPPASTVESPKPTVGGINKGAETNTPDRQADYWIALTETTGMAINYFNQPVDKLISPGWDGDYDDGFGGHVSLKLQQSGKLRINLSFSRANEGQTGEMGGEILSQNIKEGKDKELTATFINADPEVTEEAQKAVVRIRRVGHFLFVETEKAGRYAARGWFDGIYRWMPPAPN